MRNSCPVCRCAVASLYDADRARDAAAVAVGRDGAYGGDDDQEAVLERVVAMIEAIRDEQRGEEAAARAAGGDGGS
ncbi:hypothetical protein PAHAL_9G396200 [Panicum hallii]|nr:hypothetical protein PAHAL_9G396200 [Panicum hallii]